MKREYRKKETKLGLYQVRMKLLCIRKQITNSTFLYKRMNFEEQRFYNELLD